MDPAEIADAAVTVDSNLGPKDALGDLITLAYADLRGRIAAR